MGQDTSDKRKKPFQYARGAMANSYKTLDYFSLPLQFT